MDVKDLFESTQSVKGCNKPWHMFFACGTIYPTSDYLP